MDKHELDVNIYFLIYEHVLNVVDLISKHFDHLSNQLNVESFEADAYRKKNQVQWTDQSAFLSYHPHRSHMSPL